jgi:hypothetical protein
MIASGAIVEGWQVYVELTVSAKQSAVVYSG